ncbi:MAG: SAM-dependent methyltransferase [Bacteroidales bacterium]|jgi:16S rRNA G966 N2-methylase RsmD
MLNPKTIDFIIEHEKDDTVKLLLAADRYPEVNVTYAVKVIEARKKIKIKVPLWWNNYAIEYPSALALEQCSSQATAEYKKKFIKRDSTVIDITGGMGIDTFFMSQNAKTIYYFEKNSELCEATKNNFITLNCNNVNIFNTEINGVKEILENIPIDLQSADLIYADPARRGKASQRIYMISECEPNIVSIRKELFSISDNILVKVSPMADLSKCISILPETKEIHILSVNNECKEVLLLLEKKFEGTPKIFAINIKDGKTEELVFTQEEEEMAVAIFSEGEKKYLFQPNKSILKSGAFKIVSERYNITKIAASTHLYTSDNLISNFPGKVFLIENILRFNKENIHDINKKYPMANISAMNFPLDTNSLRKRLKIKEGGEKFLFACRMADEEKVIIVCEQIRDPSHQNQSI